MARAASLTLSRARMAKQDPAKATDHRRDRRKHILAHATKLFAEMGYAATTMDMLSLVAKMNKASIYYYFESKQDLLFTLICEGISHGIELSAPATKMRTARDGILHIISSGVQNLYARPDGNRISAQEFPYLAQTLSPAQYEEVLKLQRAYMKIVYEVIASGQKSGEFRQGNVKLIGSMLVQWLNAPTVRKVTSVSREEMTKMVEELFLPGLCATGTPGEG